MMDDATPKRVELVCPAGTPASLRTAVDAGADTVYCGLQNATNARNFPGLNFSPDELRKSVGGRPLARLGELPLEAPLSNGFHHGRPGHGWTVGTGASTH